MTAVGKRIIEEFEHLSDVEKREVLADILRISSRLEYPRLTNEDLVAAADAIFIEYDRRESSE